MSIFIQMQADQWQRMIEHRQRTIAQRTEEIAAIDADIGPKPAADAPKGEWQTYLARRQRRRRAIAERDEQQRYLDQLLANSPQEQPQEQQAAEQRG